MMILPVREASKYPEACARWDRHVNLAKCTISLAEKTFKVIELDFNWWRDFDNGTIVVALTGTGKTIGGLRIRNTFGRYYTVETGVSSSALFLDVGEGAEAMLMFASDHDLDEASGSDTLRTILAGRTAVELYVGMAIWRAYEKSRIDGIVSLAGGGTNCETV